MCGQIDSVPSLLARTRPSSTLSSRFCDNSKLSSLKLTEKIKFQNDVEDKLNSICLLHRNASDNFKCPDMAVRPYLRETKLPGSTRS
jgi:hypothetical protein